MYGRAPAWKDKIDDKNSSLIGHSERRIEIASGGGERRSIATRDVRVSRHRQDDCPPPTGSSPAILTKIKKEKKASRYRWDAGFSDVLPSDWHLSSRKVSDGLEGSNGEINRVGIGTSWAFIGDGHRNRLSVVSVGDLDLLATKGTAVECRVHGADEGRVRVNLTTRACVAILVEERRESTGVQAATRRT